MYGQLHNHPATNGLAKRFVQSLKTALKASHGDGHTFHHRLSSFLLMYRNSPHASTGVTPSSLFLQQNVRTLFNLLNHQLSHQYWENSLFSHDGRA